MLNEAIEVLINNTQTIQEYHLILARFAIEEAPKCSQVADGTWGVEAAERIILEEKLKDWYKDMVDEIRLETGDYQARSPYLVDDYEFRRRVVEALVIHSFGKIKFFDLARRLLEKYRELKPT